MVAIVTNKCLTAKWLFLWLDCILKKKQKASVKTHSTFHIIYKSFNSNKL